MQGQRLIQSLLMVSILTPPVAWSFTMADMEINSALNQKLDADIPIRLAPNEKPRDISVRMAEASLFEQHDINRSALLDKIQIKRIGTAIQISSNTPINVPTLEFVLETKSRKGLSYQHYKISLNKNPALNKAASHTIVASKAVSPVAIEAKPVTIPLATLAERVNKDNTFGPLQKTDSLAKIAQHIAKLNGLKTKVVQSALRDTNPNAFYKGAHGGLIAGEFLVIPDFNQAKPATVAAIATTPTATPAPTNVKVESVNKAPLASDPIVPLLLARVERLELHVEQMQIELNALKAQKLVNPAAPVDAQTPENPAAPVEPQLTTETTPALSEPAPDEPSPEAASTETDKDAKPPLFTLNDPGLIISLSLGLLALGAWITSRVVKARATKKAKTPSPKKVTKDIKKPKETKKTKVTKATEEIEEIEAFDDLDTDLLMPQKAASPASISNIPMDDSMNVDDLTEDDFEFDFLKSQANSAKAKKLKRPSSRYPADTPENLDS